MTTDRAAGDDHFLCETIGVRRIEKGQEVEAPMSIEFDATGSGLPTLLIGTDWRKRTRDFAKVKGYRVEELSPDKGMPGRRFCLMRAKEDVEKDKPGERTDRYYCLIGRGGEPTRCDCRGSASRDYCRHTDAVRHLIAVGALGPDPWPDDGPPAAEPTPTEELPF